MSAWSLRLQTMILPRPSLPSIGTRRPGSNRAAVAEIAGGQPNVLSANGCSDVLPGWYLSPTRKKQAQCLFRSGSTQRLGIVPETPSSIGARCCIPELSLPLVPLHHSFSGAGDGRLLRRRKVHVAPDLACHFKRILWMSEDLRNHGRRSGMSGNAVNGANISKRPYDHTTAVPSRGPMGSVPLGAGCGIAGAQQDWAVACAAAHCSSPVTVWSTRRPVT